jgi:hypothetical protein
MPAVCRLHPSLPPSLQVLPGLYSCVTYRIQQQATCNPVTSTHSLSPLMQFTNAGCQCR